jgi:hypothetical protein
MKRTLALTLTLGLLLTGCKAKEAMDKADIAKDLDKHGTTDLLKSVADDEYTPPADGRLTDAQVQMYLKVREQEKKIAQVAKEELKKHADKAKESGEKSLSGMMEGLKGLGSVADMATADIRAAKDLGFNTQEYLWVKQQVLEASTSDMAAKAAAAVSANFDAAYAQAKKAYDEAKDEQTRKLYAEMLAGYEKSKQEMSQSAEPQNTATAHNRQLLSKYENTLNALATELSKWEDKPGESEKAVKEWEKNIDAAAKQSKQ